MTDRELLELAAKAVGWERPRVDEDFWLWDGGNSVAYWNPLADDGDALRLAVKLGLVVDCSRPSAGEPFRQHAIWLDETMSNDALTRRAIVRAAAEIGKDMQ